MFARVTATHSVCVRARHARAARFGHRTHPREGAIAILTCLLLVFLLALIALAIDTGMLLVARSELQRSADAAALAGTWELLDERGSSQPISPLTVRNMAAAYAGSNPVRLQGPSVDLNAANDPAGELVLGKLLDPANPSVLSFANASEFNTTRVRVTRSIGQNGEVPLFFARIWGINGSQVSASAQASFLESFRGFRVPEPGVQDPPPNLMMLPIAIDIKVWKAAVNGIGADDYGWDQDKENVRPQADGITEVNLLPVDTGSGGNWGALDIGAAKTSNATLARQITDGLTTADVDFHGGELSFDAAGELHLSGNTGISAGPLGKALEAVVGQARIIPLFSEVSGNATNAQFTIVEFAGGRIMAVKMTGKKYVKVQPSTMVTRGGIPAKPGEQVTTQIFSPVKLTQ